MERLGQALIVLGFCYGSYWLAGNGYPYWACAVAFLAGSMLRDCSSPEQRAEIERLLKSPGPSLNSEKRNETIN